MPKRSQDVPAEYNEYERALAQAIGARIRGRREKLGLSQEQVRARIELEQVHISRTQFSRIELGESVPRASAIIALMRVLDCSCGWLLFGDEGIPARVD